MTSPSPSPEHALAARAFGLLATHLGEALNEARRVLTPALPHLPAETMAELDHLAEEFQRRRVRIALFGEVKAGKSTLLNALVGQVLSPVAFDPLTSVPVRVTWGSQTRWRIEDEPLSSLEDLETRMRDPHFRVPEVVVETPADLLQLGGQVDLMDTPGVGSHAHLDVVTEEALRSLDAVILVVRYPALFTRYTRSLVQKLRGDIAKLFLVWNLDAACTELTAEEQARHAEGLRAETIGGQEIFLVDAREALRSAADEGRRAGTGIDRLRQALARFVASEDRDLIALRETSKQATEWLRHLQPRLELRQQEVRRVLSAADERIAIVREQSRRIEASEQARLEAYRQGLDSIAARLDEVGGTLTAQLRRDLAAAQSHWVRNGHLLRLERGIEEAVKRYAAAMEKATGEARDALVTAAAEFGSDVTIQRRLRTEPSGARLTTEDRNVRANSGRLRTLRRALWRDWFLPGLEGLRGAALEADLAGHRSWMETVLAATVRAGETTVQERIAAATRQRDEAEEQIRTEVGYAEYAAEAQHLEAGIPALGAQVTRVSDLAREARDLLQGS